MRQPVFEWVRLRGAETRPVSPMDLRQTKSPVLTRRIGVRAPFGDTHVRLADSHGSDVTAKHENRCHCGPRPAIHGSRIESGMTARDFHVNAVLPNGDPTPNLLPAAVRLALPNTSVHRRYKNNSCSRLLHKGYSRFMHIFPSISPSASKNHLVKP